MSSAMRVGTRVAGGVAAAAVAAAVAGAVQWDRATARVVDALRADEPQRGADQPFKPQINAAPAKAGTQPRSKTWDSELAALPAPVVRYFHFALSPGHPLIRRARLTSEAEFVVEQGGSWRPLTAVQHFSVIPPGFVWDARIRIAPLMVIRARDSYVAGEGGIHARLGGVIPVVDQHGTREMNEGALQRYLAEAVWLPTALLPSAGVMWTPIDENTARATITDRGTTVSVDFHFGERGEIVRISTERYYGDAKGTPVLKPWVGEFSDYDRVDGMMVPRSGEVAWMLPEGRFPYWRGRISSAEYWVTPQP